MGNAESKSPQPEAHDGGNSLNVLQDPRPPDPAVNPVDLLRKFKECQSIVLAAANNIVVDLSDASEPKKSPNPVDSTELLLKLIKCEGTLLNAATNIVNVLTVAHSTTERDNQSVTVENKILSDFKSSEDFENVNQRDNILETGAAKSDIDGNKSEDSLLDNESLNKTYANGREDEDIQDQITERKDHENAKSLEESDSESEKSSSEAESDNTDPYFDSDFENTFEASRNLIRVLVGHNKNFILNSRSKTDSNGREDEDIEDQITERKDHENAKTLEKSDSEGETSSSEEESVNAAPYFDNDFENTFEASRNDAQTIDEVQSDKNDNISMSLENTSYEIDSETGNISKTLKRGREDTSPIPETKRQSKTDSKGREDEDIEDQITERKDHEIAKTLEKSDSEGETSFSSSEEESDNAAPYFDNDFENTFEASRNDAQTIDEVQSDKNDNISMSLENTSYEIDSETGNISKTLKRGREDTSPIPETKRLSKTDSNGREDEDIEDQITERKDHENAKTLEKSDSEGETSFSSSEEESDNAAPYFDNDFENTFEASRNDAKTIDEGQSDKNDNISMSLENTSYEIDSETENISKTLKRGREDTSPIPETKRLSKTDSNGREDEDIVDQITERKDHENAKTLEKSDSEGETSSSEEESDNAAPYFDNDFENTFEASRNDAQTIDEVQSDKNDNISMSLENTSYEIDSETGNISKTLKRGREDTSPIPETKRLSKTDSKGIEDEDIEDQITERKDHEYAKTLEKSDSEGETSFSSSEEESDNAAPYFDNDFENTFEASRNDAQTIDEVQSDKNDNILMSLENTSYEIDSETGNISKTLRRGREDTSPIPKTKRLSKTDSNGREDEDVEDQITERKDHENAKTLEKSDSEGETSSSEEESDNAAPYFDNDFENTFEASRNDAQTIDEVQSDKNDNISMSLENTSYEIDSETGNISKTLKRGREDTSPIPETKRLSKTDSKGIEDEDIEDQITERKDHEYAKTLEKSDSEGETSFSSSEEESDNAAPYFDNDFENTFEASRNDAQTIDEVQSDKNDNILMSLENTSYEIDSETGNISKTLRRGREDTSPIPKTKRLSKTDSNGREDEDVEDQITERKDHENAKTLEKSDSEGETSSSEEESDNAAPYFDNDFENTFEASRNDAQTIDEVQSDKNDNISMYLENTSYEIDSETGNISKTLKRGREDTSPIPKTKRLSKTDSNGREHEDIEDQITERKDHENAKTLEKSDSECETSSSEAESDNTDPYSDNDFENTFEASRNDAQTIDEVQSDKNDNISMSLENTSYEIDSETGNISKTLRRGREDTSPIPKTKRLSKTDSNGREDEDVEDQITERKDHENAKTLEKSDSEGETSFSSSEEESDNAAPYFDNDFENTFEASRNDAQTIDEVQSDKNDNISMYLENTSYEIDSETGNISKTLRRGREDTSPIPKTKRLSKTDSNGREYEDIEDQITERKDHEYAKTLEKSDSEGETSFSSSEEESDNAAPYFDNDFENTFEASRNDAQTIDEVQSDKNDNISMSLENTSYEIDSETGNISKTLKRGREDTSPIPETKRLSKTDSNGREDEDIEDQITERKDHENAKTLEKSDSESETSFSSSEEESDNAAPYFDNDFENTFEASRNDAQTIDEVQSDKNDNISMSLESTSYEIDSKTGNISKTLKRGREDTSPISETKRPLLQPDEDKENKKRPKMSQRRKRKILDEDSLVLNTVKTMEDENKRNKRIEERRQKYGIKYLEDKDISVKLETLALDYDPVTRAPIISVDPGLLAVLMPHQVNGVMFMWEACFESVEQIKVNNLGTGCILAHCMGLGKTLQVVTLVHTLFCHAEMTDVKRVLVVCPKSITLNWAAEFNRWLDRTHRKCEIKIYQITTLNDVQSRIEALAQWVQEGGVCVIGYTMFRQLVIPPKKKDSKEPLEPYVLDPTVKAALLDPGKLPIHGPDLVVCDEGHGLKNEDTAVVKALAQVRTRRRIMLTGTPLQNNLKEYYQMVNFVKPKLLGNKDEFNNRFEMPIYNGQFINSSQEEIDDMKRQAHVLHKLLTPTIQRKHYTMLTNTRNSFFRRKTEFGVYIELTPLQRTLYQRYLDGFTANTRKRLLRDFQTFLRIYNHPLALKDHKNCEEKRIQKEKKKKKENETKASEIALDWFDGALQGTKLEDIELSHKLSLLFQILRHCEEKGEKLLVFSQSLSVLDVIEFFLKIENKDRRWTPNEDYFRLDGTANAESREQSCKMFNSDKPNARLFLITTRAGGLGINLTAASRVVLFDVSWNPSHDVQSIFRVYRIGQKKDCFIYRFIAMGTIEEKIYKRQVTKLSVSKRVVDENQVARHFSDEELHELYKLEEPPSAPNPPRDCKSDSLLDALLKNNNCIIEYREHDSLLADLVEERLSEAEREEAWQKYEKESAGVVDPVLHYIQDLKSELGVSKDKDNKIDASTGGARGAATNIKKKKKKEKKLLSTNPPKEDSMPQSLPIDTDGGINQGASTSGIIKAAKLKSKTKKELPSKNPPKGILTPKNVTKVKNKPNQDASTSGTSNTKAEMKKLKENIKQLLRKIMPFLSETNLTTLPSKVLKAGDQGLKILKTIVKCNKSMRKSYDLTPNNPNSFDDETKYFHEVFEKTIKLLRKWPELKDVQNVYEKYAKKYLVKRKTK